MDISTMISAFSMAIAALTLLFSVITSYKSALRVKKQATLDAYNLLQEQGLDRLNDYHPENVKEIIKNEESNEYKEVSKILARIEHFSAGINEGIYDLNTLYELAHGYFDEAVYNTVIKLINQKEEDEEVFNNYKRVVKKMRIKHRKQGY